MPDCGWEQRSQRKPVGSGLAVASHRLKLFTAASQCRRKQETRDIKMLSTKSFLVSVEEHQDTLKLQVHEKGGAFLVAVIISSSSGRELR